MSAGTTLPPGPRPRPRHRGLFWLAALISTFALVGGALVAVSSYLSSAQPGTVAVAYFKALAGDNAARALSYGPVPAGDRSFLTADVLKYQLAAGAISDVQVVSVTKTGGTSSTAATVNLSYRLRGPGNASRVATDTVPMIRKGRHWWLAASAVSTKIGLAQAGKRATLAGAAFPTGSVLLFPGVLPITFDTPNLALANPDATVQFSPGNQAALAVAPSAAGITAARAAVGVALQACLAATSTNVFCPVPGNGTSAVRAVPGSLHGTLADGALDGLEVSVSPDPNGVLVVGGTVAVNGSYLSLDYTNLAAPVSDAKITV